MERRVIDAGFATVFCVNVGRKPSIHATPTFWGGRPAEGQEGFPQGISAR